MLNAFLRFRQFCKDHDSMFRSGTTQIQFIETDLLEELCVTKDDTIVHLFVLDKHAKTLTLVNQESIKFVKLGEKEYECLSSYLV